MTLSYFFKYTQILCLIPSFSKGYKLRWSVKMLSSFDPFYDWQTILSFVKEEKQAKYFMNSNKYNNTILK
jgi:hypothetical protein